MDKTERALTEVDETAYNNSQGIRQSAQRDERERSLTRARLAARSAGHRVSVRVSARISGLKDQWLREGRGAGGWTGEGDGDGGVRGEGVWGAGSRGGGEGGAGAGGGGCGSRVGGFSCKARHPSAPGDEALTGAARKPQLLPHTHGERGREGGRWRQKREERQQGRKRDMGGSGDMASRWGSGAGSAEGDRGGWGGGCIFAVYCYSTHSIASFCILTSVNIQTITKSFSFFFKY